MEQDLKLLSIVASLAIASSLWAAFAIRIWRSRPGPWIFTLSKWRLALEDWKGTRTRTIHRLHQEYGSMVQISPKEISFNSLTALRFIYGAGSGFGRTEFYRMFDTYDRQHMFSFFAISDHSKRKRLFSRLYSKSAILKGPVASSIESKVGEYLDLIESEPETAAQLVKGLRYYALDNITWMVYGDIGATSALVGDLSHRGIVNDFLESDDRRLSWFEAHLPAYTKWAMAHSKVMQCLPRAIRLLPLQDSTALYGLQDYALQVFNKCRSDHSGSQINAAVISSLLGEQELNGSESLEDLDIASECADQLDAGLNTTSDTLLFAIWALSLPVNKHLQERLAWEVATLSCDEKGVPTAESCDSIPFLDAVIKETLRLYAPIPASQPRVSVQDVTIDGYLVPGGTVVSCQGYSLHRNADIFPEPLKFSPDRWLVDSDTISEMKRWWWPFSSGGRMCIGMQ